MRVAPPRALAVPNFTIPEIRNCSTGPSVWTPTLQLGEGTLVSHRRPVERLRAIDNSVPAVLRLPPVVEPIATVSASLHTN